MSALLAGDQDRQMTIGEVKALLRPDFGDLVTISKIRFLESQGLIAPERAPSGYRRFRAEDVRRLRLVLIAQRDHYLPLRVIKERLESDTLEETLFPKQSEPEMVPSSEDAAQPIAQASIPEPEVEVQGVESPRDTPEVDLNAKFTVRELANQAGLPIDVVKQLADFGVVRADPADRFTGADVLACRAFASLTQYGVDARHMRQIKNAASRDAHLIGQSVTHMDAGQRHDVQATMLTAFSDAHYWLVKAELNHADPGAQRPRTTRR